MVERHYCGHQVDDQNYFFQDEKDPRIVRYNWGGDVIYFGTFKDDQCARGFLDEVEAKFELGGEGEELVRKVYDYFHSLLPSELRKLITDRPKWEGAWDLWDNLDGLKDVLSGALFTYKTNLEKEWADRLIKKLGLRP